MDESRMHYAKQLKPDLKGYITVWAYLYNVLEKANIQKQKTDQ